MSATEVTKVTEVFWNSAAGPIFFAFLADFLCDLGVKLFIIYPTGTKASCAQKSKDSNHGARTWRRL